MDLRPAAQDFHAAFGLNGGDDKHISVADEGGVALAAIQGLNQKVEAADASLRSEDAELKQRLEALEKIIRNQKQIERNSSMKTKLTLTFINRVALLLLLSTLKFQLSTTQAAPGDLDATFAGTGRSRVGFGGGEQFCSAVAVQGDGKLVLAGGGNTAGFFDEFEIVRFGTNHVLDASFGAGGAVFTPFNPTSIFANGASALAVKIQADGKIVAGGWADTSAIYADFALARYNPDGSLDSTFGTDGKVVTDLGTSSGIAAMVIQFDGRIVVAGYAGTNFALARYETNGVLDASFGSGGTVTTDVGGGFGVYGATALLIQSSGSYVAVGIGLNGSDFAVVRYTTNGVLDTTFGGGTGKVFTPIPGFSLNYATASVISSETSQYRIRTE